jgi:hypothetical protein
MFIYQTHPNEERALLVIRLDLGEYEMTYHHMHQSGEHQLVSFSQNRIPTHDEVNYIRGWVVPLYERFHVMNVFRASFENVLNMNELYYYSN